MTFDIRRAELRDIKGIAELEGICFTNPWSYESLLKDVRDNGLAIYFAAEFKGRVIGYAGLWKIGDEGHITNIAVHPDYRNRGIARDMLVKLFEQAAMEGVCHYTLEVRVSNDKAIRLYHSLGFDEAGIRRGYYSDTNEDAIIMWK